MFNLPSGGTHGSLLHEVQGKAPDQEPDTGDPEERQAGDTGGMPGLRDKGVQDREGIADRRRRRGAGPAGVTTRRRCKCNLSVFFLLWKSDKDINQQEIVCNFV